MLIRNIFYNIVLPFRNLSPQARKLQIFRFCTTCTTLALVVASMVSSLFTTDVYLARINCAHLDVAYGLYNSLRSSVSLSSGILRNSDVNTYDTSLTSSEISILTEYAEAQVSSAPQYIITSLWSWCYGNYNTTEYTDRNGVIHFKNHDDVVVCSSSTNHYVFDYRQELEAIGLSGILAYAYQTTEYDDQDYTQLVSRRHNMYKIVPSSLIFCAASQFVVLIFEYILYGNRGPEKDLSKIPLILLNIVALISVASFVSLGIAIGVVTRLLMQVKNQISTNLGAFGIWLDLGSVWFGLIFAALVFAFLSMTSWAFPLWCANPSDDLGNEYEGEYEHHPDNQSNRNLEGEQVDLNQSLSGIRKLKGNKKGNRRKGFLGIRMNKDVSENYREDEGKASDDEFAMQSRFNYSYNSKDEEQLRKLGETLSRKATVRPFKSKPLKSNQIERTIDKEETKQLLYNNYLSNDFFQYPRTDNIAHHYREETYDGYTESYGPTAGSIARSHSKARGINKTFDRRRANTLESKVAVFVNSSEQDRNNDNSDIESDSIQARHFLHDTKNNPFLRTEVYNQLNKKRESTTDSILNDDEMKILDHNNDINRVD